MRERFHRLVAQLRLLGLVLEDQTFEHGKRALALFLIERLQHFKLQTQSVIRSALAYSH